MFTFWRKKPEKSNTSPDPTPADPFKEIPVPFRIRPERSFTHDTVNRTKSELRISALERDIFADALTRFYEATADGKLTEEERDKLVNKYKDQIVKLDSSMNHGEKVLTLHELEEGRAELLKMFHDKFGDMNAKIEDFRKGLGITPKEVAEPKVPSTTSAQKETKPSPPPSEKSSPPTPPTTSPRKSKADEVLEKMREDLQKELEKLEQIEMEV